MPWRDLAKEMVAARASGGTLTLPQMLDGNGHKLLDYTPPHQPGFTQIFRWKRDCDLDIWKSLEVPPEMIEAFSAAAAIPAAPSR